MVTLPNNAIQSIIDNVAEITTDFFPLVVFLISVMIGMYMLGAVVDTIRIEKENKNK
jgi:putative effector of murein hydrolase LrgA (UPF0299 family)